MNNRVSQSGLEEDSLLGTVFCTAGSMVFSETLTSSTWQKNSQRRLVDVVGHTTYRTAKYKQHRGEHHQKQGLDALVMGENV